MDLSEFFENQARLLQYLPPRVRKNFMDRINWKIRLLGIVGARGTGKTTLLLQHLSRQKGAMERHLYISADHVKIHAMGLYEAASAFFRLGGESVYIDEVHKYPDWAREIKNLYDAFPGVRIRFSGSSTLALQAGKADLSRRGLFYDLPGFSFREYLEFMTDVEYRPLSLSELLSGHE